MAATTTTEEQEPTPTHMQVTPIDLDLSLSLSLRPSTTPPPTTTTTTTNTLVLKREEQAMRRQEAKRKRDVKKRKVEERERSRENGGNGSAAPTASNMWWGWPYKNGNENDNATSSVSGGSSSSSSGVSDYHSNSGPGANSSDAGSHLSNPPPHSQLQPSTQAEIRPDSSAPRHSTPPLCRSSSGSAEPNLSDAVPQQHKNTVISRADNSLTPVRQSSCVDVAKCEIRKPPKPNGHINQQDKLPLPQMPCVSTTGNGPNGKKISGFLYKYPTKAEVSIICVCHGVSFSPAGFVEHAGGVDIENPLRHIRVAPFALA